MTLVILEYIVLKVKVKSLQSQKGTSVWIQNWFGFKYFPKDGKKERYGRLLTRSQYISEDVGMFRELKND